MLHNFGCLLFFHKGTIMLSIFICWIILYNILKVNNLFSIKIEIKFRVICTDLNINIWCTTVILLSSLERWSVELRSTHSSSSSFSLLSHEEKEKEEEDEDEGRGTSCWFNKITNSSSSMCEIKSPPNVFIANRLPARMKSNRSEPIRPEDTCKELNSFFLIFFDRIIITSKAFEINIKWCQLYYIKSWIIKGKEKKRKEKKRKEKYSLTNVWPVTKYKYLEIKSIWIWIVKHEDLLDGYLFLFKKNKK